MRSHPVLSRGLDSCIFRAHGLLPIGSGALSPRSLELRRREKLFSAAERFFPPKELLDTGRITICSQSERSGSGTQIALGDEQRSRPSGGLQIRAVTFHADAGGPPVR